MVWVAGGSFTMGSDHAFPEEGAGMWPPRSPGFWMDQTEVTNAQFAQFVAATGYRTLAERGMRLSDAPDAPVIAGSAVFRPRGEAEAMRSFVNWWQFQAAPTGGIRMGRTLPSRARTSSRGAYRL